MTTTQPRRQSLAGFFVCVVARGAAMVLQNEEWLAPERQFARCLRLLCWLV